MGKRRRSQRSSSSESSSTCSEERYRRRKKKQKLEREHERRRTHDDKHRTTSTTQKKDKLSPEEQTIASSADIRDRVKAILDLDDTASSALLALAQRLDGHEGVQLHAIEDPRARKKLRHLLYTLDVESVPDPISRVPTHFKKSTSSFNISKILSTVMLSLPSPSSVAVTVSQSSAAYPTSAHSDARSPHETPQQESGTLPSALPSSPEPRIAPRGPALADLPQQRAAHLSKIEAEDEYGPSLPTEAEVDDGRPRREEWMQLAPQSLAGAFGSAKKTPAVHSTIDPRKKLLQEEEQKRMAEEMAFYQEQRGVQKSLAEIHRENTQKGVQLDLSKWKPEDDVWGTSAVEQHFKSKQKTLNSKDNPTGGQPWRRFDRERDLNTSRPASAADCEKMREVVKASTGRFGASSFLSSNV